MLCRRADSESSHFVAKVVSVTPFIRTLIKSQLDRMTSHDTFRLGDGDADASTLLISTKGRLRHSSLNSDSEIPSEQSLIDHGSQSKDN